MTQRRVTEGKTSIGVFKDKGKKFESILVRIGGGLKSCMGVHIANNIATLEGSHVPYIRVISEEFDEGTNKL